MAETLVGIQATGVLGVGAYLSVGFYYDSDTDEGGLFFSPSLAMGFDLAAGPFYCKSTEDPKSASPSVINPSLEFFDASMSTTGKTYGYGLSLSPLPYAATVTAPIVFRFPFPVNSKVGMSPWGMAF